MTFLQRVKTPMGKGSYIGTLANSTVIVALMVPAISLSRDECLHRSPRLAELPQIDFLNWQKTAAYCINKIFQPEEVEVVNS